jgi:hypothetical protein
MRPRGTAVKPVRSTDRREPKVDCDGRDGGKRERALEGANAPRRSTFRRVAVFVPFSASDAPDDTWTSGTSTAFRAH